MYFLSGEYQLPIRLEISPGTIHQGRGKGGGEVPVPILSTSGVAHRLGPPDIRGLDGAIQARFRAILNNLSVIFFFIFEVILEYNVTIHFV